MRPMFNTLAGRACIARLIAKSLREGLSIQEFGRTYRDERGWGDPSVASLVALWAQGDNPETFSAERERLNAEMTAALVNGDAVGSEYPRITGPRITPVTAKGKELAERVRAESTRLRLAEDHYFALAASDPSRKES